MRYSQLHKLHVINLCNPGVVLNDQQMIQYSEQNLKGLIYQKLSDHSDTLSKNDLWHTLQNQ